MKNEIYSIYDEKAQVFGTPFFQMNEGTAVRAFNDLAADPQSSVYRHPQDYKLYRLGEFEDRDGVIVPLSTPEFIINAQLNLQLGEPHAPPQSESTE